jgi:hypothetical protein
MGLHFSVGPLRSAARRLNLTRRCCTRHYPLYLCPIGTTPHPYPCPSHGSEAVTRSGVGPFVGAHCWSDLPHYPTGMGPGIARRCIADWMAVPQDTVGRQTVAATRPQTAELAPQAHGVPTSRHLTPGLCIAPTCPRTTHCTHHYRVQPLPWWRSSRGESARIPAGRGDCKERPSGPGGVLQDRRVGSAGTVVADHSVGARA